MLTATSPSGYPATEKKISVHKRRKLSLLVRIEPDGGTIRLEGRQAWALRELVNAGSKGCTPITNPGPRWSDYVFRLRKLGFVVETEYEKHGGQFSGHHALYRIHSKVTILEDSDKQ